MVAHLPYLAGLAVGAPTPRELVRHRRRQRPPPVLAVALVLLAGLALLRRRWPA